MDSLEYIDNYFRGLLTEEERSEFDKRILSDPAFAEDLAFYINAGNLVKAQVAAEKTARFRALYDQHRLTKARPSPVIRLWPFAAAAAVLIVVAGLWWIFARPAGPEKLANTYIDRQLANLPVKMSSVQDSLEKAVSLYNEGRLEEALERFRQILQKDPDLVQAKNYAGIVYLRIKEYDKALDYFQQSAKDTTLYSNPAVFYESLTLMKRNRPGDASKARQLLQVVVDHNLDKKEDATEMLKNW